MVDFTNPSNVVTFMLWLLMIVLQYPLAHGDAHAEDGNDSGDNVVGTLGIHVHKDGLDVEGLMRSMLHHYRFCTSYNMYEDDLGFWVKPRSTIWFSKFLLEQYDNKRWIQMFQMTKLSVFALADLLRPHVEKQDTRYRVAIPVLIRIACTLFKLTYGASLTICSELFAIGRSTISKILKEVVSAINDTLRHEIKCPTRDRCREVQSRFHSLYGLPSVVGAINGTYFTISKPKLRATDYYYFKSSRYTMNCQAIVDSDKHFFDLYEGMSGSTNDSRMLRRSFLYHAGMQGNLFDSQCSMHGQTPFFIGDMGYPLLQWLMVLYKSLTLLSVSENLFNKRLRKGRVVVENAFGILKGSFRELLEKSDLHVSFLPDVILCCAILHNLLLGQSHEDVEELMSMLQSEGLDGEIIDDEFIEDGPAVHQDEDATPKAHEKRLELGVYLTLRRGFHA